MSLIRFRNVIQETCISSEKRREGGSGGKADCYPARPQVADRGTAFDDGS